MLYYKYTLFTKGKRNATMQNTVIDSTAVRGKARRIGFVRGIWERIAGQKSKELKIEDHSRGILRIGRILAPAVIVIFSLAFAFQLTGPTFQNIQNGLTAGAFPTRDLIIFGATIAGIVILDFTMILMFTQVRDHIARKESFGVWWAKLAWGLAVCAIEGGTFLWMLLQGEPNANGWQILLDAGRSLMTPAAAVILVITPERTLTPDEAIRFVFRKVAVAAIELLEDITVAGTASFDNLMKLFFKLANYKSGDDAQALLKDVQTELEKISPSAIQTTIRELTERAESAEARIEATVNEWRLKLQSAESEFTRRLDDAFATIDQRVHSDVQAAAYGLVLAGEVPAELAARIPALANLRVQAGAQPRRIAAPKSAAENVNTPTGDLRASVLALGLDESELITEIKVPVKQIDPADTKKKIVVMQPKTTRAFWVTGATVTKLIAPGKPFDGEDGKEVVKRLGEGAKAGTSFVASLLVVLKDLDNNSKLHPDLVRFVRAGEGDADADEGQ